MPARRTGRPPAARSSPSIASTRSAPSSSSCVVCANRRSSTRRFDRCPRRVRRCLGHPSSLAPRRAASRLGGRACSARAATLVAGATGRSGRSAKGRRWRPDDQKCCRSQARRLVRQRAGAGRLIDGAGALLGLPHRLCRPQPGRWLLNCAGLACWSSVLPITAPRRAARFLGIAPRRPQQGRSACREQQGATRPTGGLLFVSGRTRGHRHLLDWRRTRAILTEP